MSEIREARLRELDRIRGELDTLFERTLAAGGLASSSLGEGWSPPLDMAETESFFHLTFELPGVERSDIELRLDGSRLILEGERKAQAEAESKRYLRMERHHGRFRREIELGKSPVAEGIEAHLENGLLSVRVAKSSPRKVEIRSVGDE